ncbi:MAG: DUF1571 domain-containing protein, partial [Planctomycetia bacterium]|nr:DUF1571 domain-containing protein [Planctomycetia bacterium]
MRLHFLGNLVNRRFFYSLFCFIVGVTLFSEGKAEESELVPESSLISFLDAEILSSNENGSEIVPLSETGVKTLMMDSAMRVKVDSPAVSVSPEIADSPEIAEVEAVVAELTAMPIGSVESQGEKQELKVARSTIFEPMEGEIESEAPLRWARDVERNIQSEITGYTCTLTKRERVNGILGKEEVMEAKIRHEPFSVYLRFKKPRRYDGREVIFVENANEGKLLVHGVGFEAIMGTLSLEPTGRTAMKNNRHPITEVGILNLVRHFQKMGKENLENPTISVQYLDIQFQGRDCVCVEVKNGDRKLNPLFQKAHIYVDMELNLPIKYMAWGWGNDGDFPLMEEYTYSDLKINPELTDADFDIHNSEY